MAELSITRSITATTASVRHPKAILVPDSGAPLTLPYAPVGTSLGGLADTWETQDRAGRKPIVSRNGDGIATLAWDITLTRLDHQQPVEDYLAALATMAGTGARITIVGMSPRERGPWRLTDINITGSARQQGTNAITRATVSLSFLQASDAAPKLGPVHGGKAATKTVKKAKKYRIRKGDTLRKIATKFYGTPTLWKLIAKRNKIKHPDKLKAGHTITIPPNK